MDSIIVYGMGEMYCIQEGFIKNNYHVVAYCDRDDKKTEYIKPQEIHNYEYDFVYITSKKFYKEIKDYLIILGINENEIINGYDIWMEHSLKKALDVLENRKREYEGIIRNTSITDNLYYIIGCKAVAKSDKFMDTFRSNAIFIKTYELFTRKWGDEYAKLLSEDKLFSRSQYDSFIKNDEVGGPKIHDFQIGDFTIQASTNTLRYIKVLSDLQKIYREQITTITEIGTGYGGQARILIDYFKNVQYRLVDIPEALSVATKYLKKMNIEEGVEYIDGTADFAPFDSDLLISNYAFSELQRNVQQKYLNKIILRSKHGYITWNSLSYKELDGFSVDELLKKIPNCKVIEERPLTNKDNCILTW